MGVGDRHGNCPAQGMILRGNMRVNIIPPGSLARFTDETTVWNVKMIGWMREGDLAIILEVDTRGTSWYRIASSRYTGWVTGDHMEKVS